MVTPWQPISKPETIWQKYGKSIEKVDFRLPDGKIADFYLQNLGKRAGSVLAITREKTVILTRQFRPGPGRILWEPPGGWIGADENPEDALRRELLEETGFVPKKMIFAGSTWAEANSGAEKFSFIALGCEKQAGQKLDATEDIEIVELPLAEAAEKLWSGETTSFEVFLALRMIETQPEILET